MLRSHDESIGYATIKGSLMAQEWTAMICLWASEADEATALAGGWPVRGAEGSNGCKPLVPGAGMMLNDTYV